MGDNINQSFGEYSNYLKVDIAPDVKRIEESIDETLTRLEEFENVLEMVRSNTALETTSCILSKREELVSLCERVLYLEAVTHQVKQNVDKAENLVLEAETHVKNTAEGKIRSILKPLFTKKTEVTTSPGKNAAYCPPKMFKTSQFFTDKHEGKDSDSNR